MNSGMDITVKRAQPMTHPKGKPFYVQVDGKYIGEEENMFYKTKREAMAIGKRYLLAKENLK